MQNDTNGEEMSDKSDDYDLLRKKLGKASAYLATPNPLTGKTISMFEKAHGLTVHDMTASLGLNTSTLYAQKRVTMGLAPNLSILLRLYSAFPHQIPKLNLPTIESVIEKIKAVDPNFNDRSIAPLLGFEMLASTRLLSQPECTNRMYQPTQRLLYLIDQLLTEDPENWWVIKQVVEVEAEASEIDPPEQVWTVSGYQRNTKIKKYRKKTNSKSKETKLLEND